MLVVNPADAVSAKKLLNEVVDTEGPAYVRLGRSGVPVIYDESSDIKIGKANVIREGSDVTIIATGIMVSDALEAAEELAGEGELTILCGHYEGVDERALTELSAEEISIGDYVLTGGELPAMVLVDAVARFIPGVLASDESVLEESIYSGLLEYPQYTRPRTMEEGEVPEVLLSGDHKKIDLWRFEQAMRLTKERRPDMWQEFVEKFRADEKAYSKKERLLIESVIRY